MGCYVIGDIHGCLDEVRRLIDDLPLVSGDSVVFLGDYIDRGPDSRGVVAYLLSLERDLAGIQLVFLKGNHEDMLLSYLGLGGRHGDMFLINGGSATLSSYGIAPHLPSPQQRLSLIPESHLDFYQGLKKYHLTGDFLCVHAGIHPHKSLDEQSEEELLWIRDMFIYRPHSLPFTVLFGHTPQSAVFYNLPYKIGLDTGLVYGNMLTCLEVDEKVLFQIRRGQKNVQRTSAQRSWLASARIT